MELVLEGDGTDLSKCCVRQHDKFSIAVNQILVKLEKLAFTANNISYASVGIDMHYFQFFPVENGQAPPTWAIGRVVASRCKEVCEGEMLYGFFPYCEFAVIEGTTIAEDTITDLSPHRKSLPVVYNQYSRLDSDLDLLYRKDTSLSYMEYVFEYMILLRPLFLTSWLLKQYAVELLPAGGQFIIVSASSKTAYSLGYLLAHTLDSNMRAKLKLIGVTSKANQDFTNRLNVYDQTVVYEDVEREFVAPEYKAPTHIFDMSGNGDILNAIVKAIPGSDCTLIGYTHINQKSESKPPGNFFFAPTYYISVLKKIGQSSLNELMRTDWNTFAEHVHKQGWCKIETRKAADHLLSTWISALQPKGIKPNQGVVFTF